MTKFGDTSVIDLDFICLRQGQCGVQHMDQLGKAADLGMKHAHAHLDRQNAAQGLNPDGSPIQPPGEGGGPPGAAAAVAPSSGGGGGIVPGPNEVGAGGAPLNPAQVGEHGVPAADAGQQQQADAADQQANLESALKKQPKSRTVKIAKRGPDGRASEFHIQEH